MKSFLEYVAEDIIRKYGTDLSRTAVVFPNKRASLFLNEHLARLAGKPVWSPSYITISQFFRSKSNLQVGDPIKLVCDLHKSFIRQTGFDESIDHFYGWGQILLADFDDLDKNMADASRVFANLRDIHELDDTTYLSEEQKTIIRKFFSNFSDDHNSLLKERFLKLWSRMADIYADFNDMLQRQGIAYEGALYRQVAESTDTTFEFDRYLFVGFNVVQRVEQTLFSRLQEQGKAHFYWDFDDYYLRHNEAGHYIAQYLEKFPNEFDIHDPQLYHNFERHKDITYLSASTESIQAHYISDWLRQGTRIADGHRTAIVLCDEHLLPSVIHALPDEVSQVNVTTGYPLSQSPIAGMLHLLVNLQTIGFNAQRNTYRNKYLENVRRHPYAVYLPDDFTLMEHDGTTPQATFLAWLTRNIRAIATNASELDDPLFQESVFRTYTLLNRLTDLVTSGDLQTDMNTLQRLIGQLVSSTTIPFHGEPVKGVQVMGVLETRNIDFDHVLLLSCNDGNLPGSVNDTSFIPYNIRKAHGLTTIDNKVAIYAYYFHRLLQRAHDVTITYNSRTTDGKTGEKSRFMLQMMVESRQPIAFRHLTFTKGQNITTNIPSPIDKDANVMSLLHQRFDVSENKGSTHPLLTPTAINRYMRCQLQFYYNYVCGLREPQEEEEEGIIDNRVFGNIFHEAAQLLYEKITSAKKLLTKSDFAQVLKNPAEIEMAVDESVRKNLSINPRQMSLNGMQIINREVIIHFLRQLLEVDMQLAPFTIIGLEQDVIVPLSAGQFMTTIGGRIDRLDQVTEPQGERIRVIDYKTGSRELKPLADVEAIFKEENLKNHSDYYLQTFVYANIVREKSSLPVSPALLFIQHAGKEGYDPTLCLGRDPIRDVAASRETFLGLLQQKVEEMFSPSKPFVPTENDETCGNCPYRALCYNTLSDNE